MTLTAGTSSRRAVGRKLKRPTRPRKQLAFDILEDRYAPATLLHSLFPDAGPQSDAQFGASIAASAAYYVVGAPSADVQENPNTGQVFVYDANSGLLIRTIENPVPAADDQFGFSVAISGNLLAVGARLDSADAPYSGTAYVFNVLTGALIWTLNNPTPAHGDMFGFTVAISDNTVAVGAPRFDQPGTGPGSAYLFDATTGGLVATLSAPAPADNDQFGRVVAVSGGKALIAACDGGVYPGPSAVHVFTTAGAYVAAWTSPADDLFGLSIALSGNIAVIGAPKNDATGTNSGRAYVYDATTMALVATLDNPTPGPNDQFGSAVSIAGNRVVVGAHLDDTGFADSGSAYAFDATTGALLASLNNPTPAADDNFGSCVAIAGTTAVVSAPRDDTGTFDAGSVYLMGALIGATWASLNNPTQETGDNLGQGVAMSDDYIVVGVPQAGATSSASGLVYVFSATTGELLRKLYSPGALYSYFFGADVAISGNLIAVSASNLSGLAYGTGVVYVFDATSGSLVSTIVNPSPDYGDGFGKMALFGTTIVVASSGDDAVAVDSGLAYLFNALTGELLVTLNNPTPAAGDEFGASVAISGNRVVVGARHDDTSGFDVGIAYVFDATSGLLVATLNNPMPAANDAFGNAVGISGNTVVVGAVGKDASAGMAFLFNATTGSLLSTLYNPTPTTYDSFGNAVAIVGNTALVAAFGDSTGAIYHGSVYAFDVGTGSLVATIPNPTPAENDGFGYDIDVIGNRLIVGAINDDTVNYNQGAAYEYDLGVAWDGGGGNSNWNDPNNWSTNSVPGPTDNVFINVPGSIVIELGSGTHTINSLICAEGLTIAGGTLTINSSSSVAGPLIVSSGTLRSLATFDANGSFEWSGGTVSGIGAFNSYGLFSMTSASTKLLAGKILRLHGGGTWNTGDLAMDDGAILEVPNGQNFGVQGNNAAVRNTGLGTATINVLGTLTRAVASGTAAIGANVAFNNSGLVLVQSGTFSLNGGGTDSGGFLVSSGATLTFSGGLHALSAASSVSGAGTVNVGGGTVNIAGAFAPGGAVSVTGGLANVNSTVALTGSLTVSGGELSGIGNITVAGSSSWTGGKLSGAGQVLVNGGLNIAGTAPMFLVGKSLKLVGGGVWTTGDLAMDDGAVLEIPTGSTLNQQGTGGLVRDTNTGTANVIVQGTITKSVSAGTAGIGAGIGLSNTGEINVNSGTLILPNGGTHTGIFAVASGALLEFAAGSNNFVPGSLITGLGNVRISGGTTTFAGGFTLTGTLSVVSTTVQTTALFNGDIQIASLSVFGTFGGGSVLGGTGNITVTGPTTWSAGRIEGGGTLSCNGGLTIDTAALKTLWGKTLTFAGNVIWTGGDIAIDRGATFRVPIGAILDAQADNALVRSDLAGTATLDVLGTLRKASGAGTTSIDATIAIAQLATVNVLAGTLALPGGRTYAGAFNLSTGSNLQLSAGNNTFTATSSVSGGGNLAIAGGTTQFDGPVSLGGLLTVSGTATAVFNATTSVSDLLLGLSAPTITGSGNITVTGATTWHAGIISGTGSFTANGAVVLTNPAMKRLSGKSFYFNAATTWTSGEMAIDEGAILNVGAGGVLDCQSNNAIVRFTGIGAAMLNNYGIVRKSAGAGESAISVPFENFGTIEALTGTLTIGSGFANFASSALTGGTYLVAGIFQFPGANVVANAAVIELVGTASSIRNSTTSADALANFANNTATGSFSLSGGRNFTSIGAFHNAGAVLIALGSTFATAIGDYTQTAGSTVVNGVLHPAGNLDLQGGVLAGSGMVAAPILVSGTGTIAPGGSPGIFNASQGLALAVGASYAAEINGSVAGTGYDQINVVGEVNLGGAQLVVVPGFTPTLGQSFVIVSNDDVDAIVGTFAGLAEGAVFTVGGKTFSITYVGGVGDNDVVLTAAVADSTPPLVVDIVDVAPDPRTTPVASIDIVLSEPINLATFTTADVALFRDGGFVPFSGNESVVLVSGSTYRIAGLSEETAAAGSYLFVVNVANVADLAGNWGTNAAIDSWINNFSLDATAPVIVGMYFDGSTWSAGFRAAAGNATYGYPAQSGIEQLRAMPWSTINTIYVRFSENVSIANGHLWVRGIHVANYFTTMTYDAVNFVAKFSLTTPFETDRVIFDLDGDGGSAIADQAGNPLAGAWTEGVSAFPTSGAAGSDFKYRFVVAVGDADRNGVVRNADLNLVRNNLFVDAGQGGYNIFADIDGNGVTRNADLNAVRNHLFIDPPAGPGPFRAGRQRGAHEAPPGPNGRGNRWMAPPGADDWYGPAARRRPSPAQAAASLDALFEEI